jgi:hypothetical protein
LSPKVSTSGGGGSGPTKTEIVNFARECVEKKVSIDPIARFGTDSRGTGLRGIGLPGVKAGRYTSGAGRTSEVKFEEILLTDTSFDGAKFAGENLKGATFSSCMKGVCSGGTNLETPPPVALASRLPGLRAHSLIFPTP